MYDCIKRTLTCRITVASSNLFGILCGLDFMHRMKNGFAYKNYKTKTLLENYNGEFVEFWNYIPGSVYP